MTTELNDMAEEPVQAIPKLAKHSVLVREVERIAGQHWAEADEGVFPDALSWHTQRVLTTQIMLARRWIGWRGVEPQALWCDACDAVGINSALDVVEKDFASRLLKRLDVMRGASCEGAGFEGFKREIGEHNDTEMLLLLDSERNALKFYASLDSQIRSFIGTLYPGVLAEVPSTPLELPEDGVRMRFQDRDGNVHVLVDGKCAARIIAEGGVPEILSLDSEAMHDGLDEVVGAFANHKDHGRYAIAPCRYVVHHFGGGSGFYRVATFWTPGDHAPDSRELAGWGCDPGNPVLSVDVASELEAMTHVYEVTLSVPVARWDNPDSKTVLAQEVLDAFVDSAKKDDAMPTDVTAVKEVVLQPIEEGGSPFFDLKVVLNIKALDERSARRHSFIGKSPFLGGLAGLLNVQVGRVAQWTVNGAHLLAEAPRQLAATLPPKATVADTAPSP